MSRTLLCAMQILLQIIEYVLELGQVFGVSFDEGFVRLEHILGLSGVIGGSDGGRKSVAHGGAALPDAAGIHGKELIEAEIGEEVVVALVEIDDVQVALPDLAQAEGDHGKGAHEGGIHDRTVAQIDDEFAMAAIDHFLGEFLDAGAVKERAFPFHLDPDDLVGGADEDGRRYAHLKFCVPGFWKIYRDGVPPVKRAKSWSSAARTSSVEPLNSKDTTE